MKWIMWMLAWSWVALAGSPGDAMLAHFFELEVQAIEARSAAALTASSLQETRRQELAFMLGLVPEPARSPLAITRTGTIEQEAFRVEKLHYQAMPGMYVTGNLYLPKQAEKPLPAILYVCGHGRVKKDGVSYGNKAHYQHHGAWFARHGYVCLTIDTIQLGEIEGTHHGTYREGMWWWNSRGYTPAGAEAWAGMRGIDLLVSRPEVDADRIGITGRSGGGAYSWWVAALDTRIKAAVPVAGITSLRDHVIESCIEGHCDCMYMINSKRWDFAEVAALIAPRALLISNTDKDPIFPLNGVVDVHQHTRDYYRLLKAEKQLGLNICEGGHRDTQQLRVNAFEWFDRHLKGIKTPGPYTVKAEPLFEVEALKVFDELPQDERSSTLHETFVAKGKGGNPARWMAHLNEHVFAAWPTNPVPLNVTREDGRLFFDSDAAFRLSIALPEAIGDTLVLHLGERGSDAHFLPRGLGASAWTANEKQQTHIRRRMVLLGHSLDSLRVWDVRRAIQALRTLDEFRDVPLRLEAGRDHDLGDIALYASLYEPVDVLHVGCAESHRSGATFLHVLRGLDIPQAFQMAEARSQVKRLP